jgi:hypothetical protein
MLYRVLILLFLAVLAGCGQNQDSRTGETVSLNTYRVLDSAQFNNYFTPYDTSDDKYSRAIDFLKPDYSLDSTSGKLLYDVCFSDVDSVSVKHPCSLDSALLVSLAKKLNYKDPQKGIEVRLQYVYYNAYENSSPSLVLKDGLLIFKGDPFYSPIYLNDDSTYQALCQSSDGLKCDELFARVVVSKKLFPDSVLTAEKIPWVEEKYSVYVDESIFAERFETDYLFSSIYYKRIHPYEGDGVIPFEMCFKDGLAYPCNLSSTDFSRIQRAIEKDGDTLIALSHQSHRIWTMESFALDGMSGLHTCKSTAGKTCDEIFALARRNKEHEEGFLGWLALYRFKMTDLSFTLEQLDYLDKIPLATVGLRKKDGTLIAGIR